MLYLKNCRYIDWETLEISSVNIKIEDGVDGGIEFVDSVSADAFDCKGKFVTKSFGCGHHHIYSALARGMPAPKKIPENFLEILQYVWWTLDKCLDRDMIEASALASAMYCAKNGVTFVIDHHASPFAVDGSLSVIEKAFEKVGISSLLCYELSDRDGADIAQAGLDEHERFFSSGGQGHVGLHASFTVGDELLGRADKLAKKFGTGVHVHVAEDKYDQDEALRVHGKRVVERLYESGVMDQKQSILSHCVHLDDNECELVKKSGVWVAENIESNQNNNVGQAAYRRITDNIILGTDGMHSDMLRSAKAAFFSGQPIEGVGYDEIYNRFRNIHRYIAQSGFKGDSANNLVILDYDTPTELTSDNFLGHFLFGIESSKVESVISNGEFIVKDRMLCKADEEEIMAFSREMGVKLWKEMQK